MKRTPQKARLLTSLGLGGLVLIAISYWYSWSATPLTSQEIDAILRTIEHQEQVPGGRHDLSALRAFLESDDGRPFYTVNLYEYHDRARYQPGTILEGTGREAFDRFSRVMVPLLVQHASHPIFGSDWVGPSNKGWDRIVIVRYRSRRDIAKIFATDEFAEASAHKWAGLKNNDRMLVEALHIPGGLLPIVLIALVVAALFYALATVRLRGARTAEQAPARETISGGPWHER